MAKWHTSKYSGDFNISYTEAPAGNTWDIHHINCVLLADIRRELQKLNALLGCSSFVGVPKPLHKIAHSTKQRKRQAKKVKHA